MGYRYDDRRHEFASEVVSKTILRDIDIRAWLTPWLMNAYSNDASTALYEELAIPRPSSRADIAVVNGALVGYEIKSDVDSCARLPQQIKSYGYIFDRVYLVTTERKSLSLSSAIPIWWGIIAARENGTIKLIRSSKKNRGVSCEHVLYLLNVPELRKIAKQLDLCVGTRMTKAQINSVICKRASKTKILRSVREALKERKIKI